jgi:hypothetical protein
LILAFPELVKRNTAWAHQLEVYGGERIIEGTDQIVNPRYPKISIPFADYNSNGLLMMAQLYRTATPSEKYTASQKVQAFSQLHTMELSQQRENELVSNERLWVLVIGF